MVQPALEDECRHAALGQRAGDIPTLVLHGEGSEAADRRDHDGGAGGFGTHAGTA
jgi:hypothetical protein